MSLFNFNEIELIAFFVILVRFSTLLSILPIFGDRFIPGPAKILLAFIMTEIAFHSIANIHKNYIQQIGLNASSVSGIVFSIGSEVLTGLALGFAARFVFEGITFGANFIGNLMGFASATFYDPHQESQTPVIAEIQTSIAMLLFLTLDGHHLMLRAITHSFNLVEVGKVNFNLTMVERLTWMSSQIFSFGIELAAPVAISLFGVNLVFGLISKALPQMNILVLSLSVSGLVGLTVIFLGIPEFFGLTKGMLENVFDWMNGVSQALGQRGV